METEGSSLTIDVERGTTSILTLTGELDPLTAPRLDDAVAAVLDGTTTELVIDVAGLAFVDSSGLRSMIKAHLAIEPKSLRVRNPTAFVENLLSITGLDGKFTVEHDDPS